jgi:hypothetical protein
MGNIEIIQKRLEELKISRNEGLPIAEWRSSALGLFVILCSGGAERDASKYEVAKSLSKKLAIECMAELDCYFHTFGYVSDDEGNRWRELTEHLRGIYS